MHRRSDAPRIGQGMSRNNLSPLPSRRVANETDEIQALLANCDDIAHQVTVLRQRIEYEMTSQHQNPEPSVTPQLLTARQAAQYLSIGVSSLYRLVQAGDIPAVHIAAKTTRYRRADLDHYISHLTSTAV